MSALFKTKREKETYISISEFIIIIIQDLYKNFVAWSFNGAVQILSRFYKRINQFKDNFITPLIKQEEINKYFITDKKIYISKKFILITFANLYEVFFLLIAFLILLLWIGIPIYSIYSIYILLK